MIRSIFQFAGVFVIGGALAIGCGSSQEPEVVNPATNPITEPATTAPAKTTDEVLAHHLESFGKGDVDAILSDYNADSFLLTPMGALTGTDQIKSLFQGLVAEFAKPDTKFELQKKVVKGEIGYIIWSAETADNVYEIGTDTFVIRDGKIVAQTFAVKIAPKAKAEAPAADGPPAAPEGPTATVLLHHLKAFREGNMEEILADYAADATLFSPMGEMVGADGVKPLFTALFAEFAKPGATFAMKQMLVEGDVAYIVWSAETADNVYELVTDTLVIKDGKIVAQTFAGKITPKAAK